MEKILHLLRGSVRVRVETRYPERILNLCGAHRLPFRDLSWQSAEAFSFTLTRRDYHTLRRLMRPLSVNATVAGRGGLPFFLRRFRRRYTLLAGLGAFALLLAANACFIWDFTVTGNETVPTETILRALEANGLRRGSFAWGYSSQDLCNRVLPEIPQLCWLTVNVRGCRACVQVKERVLPPELADEKRACNVVAAKAGLVTRVLPLDGEARVLPGMTVQAGQLLISGVVETKGTERPSVPARIYAGTGEVYGRTWYELSARIPLTFEARGAVQSRTKRFSLLIGKKRVKFYQKKDSISEGECDKIRKQTRLRLFGLLALPLTWETETTVVYDTAAVEHTRAEAEQIGKELLERELLSRLGKDGSVLSERCSSARQGDGMLLVTLCAECSEQIGMTVPILLE